MIDAGILAAAQDNYKIGEPRRTCLILPFCAVSWGKFAGSATIVLIDRTAPTSETRYVYTDGRGFLSETHRFPMWYGESQGFWDGNELIVWTKSFKGWVITHALPEYSDKLETIERIKRVGDRILVDLTLYDPEAFAYPWHDAVVFSKLRDWKTASPTFYRMRLDKQRLSRRKRSPE